jgi:toxin ParE1/3/4
VIVVITAEAEADLERIATYIAEHSAAIALNFVQELPKKCESLADAPRGYPLVPRYEHLGIRRRPFGNYLISIGLLPKLSKSCTFSTGRATTSPCFFPKRKRGAGRFSPCPAIRQNHGLGPGVVPRKGLEPSRPLSHWHLKPARLPIPPPGPGPVSTDRSRACQIVESLPKYAVQRGHDGVSRNR